MWSLHRLNFVIIESHPPIKRGRDRESDPALMPPTCHGMGGDQSTDAPESTAIIEVADQVFGCLKGGRKMILGIDCHATREPVPDPDEILFIGLIVTAGTSASCKWLLLFIDILHVRSSSYSCKRLMLNLQRRTEGWSPTRVS